MTDIRKPTVSERIDDVERRLEMRRGRIEYNVREIKERLARKSTWWPVGAAAGAIAIGFAVARARSQRNAARTLYVPRRRYEERKVSKAASVLGLAGGLLRIALSPQGRALWQAFRRGVERGRAYAASARGAARRAGEWR